MASRLITLLLLATTLSACVNVQRVKLKQKIEVTTSPPNAHIWRGDKTGRQAVGQAPMVLDEEYEQRTIKLKAGFWVSLVAMVAASAAGFVLGATSDSGDSWGYIIGGVAGGMALGMVPLAFTHNSTTTTKKIITVGASSPGYSDAWLKLQVPESVKKKDKGPAKADEQKVHITLGPAGGKAGSAPTTKPTDEPKRPIVAVFDLEDNKRKLTAQKAGELAEYLATQLTATGHYRTIPRSQLRKRLSGEKKKGYKACFDEACQIELGRALAAQKSLATKIIRVGKLCTVTSVLYDLKTETSERAASTAGPCTTEGLLASLQAQAKKLAGK